MEIIKVKIDDIKPYENNPRNNDDAVDYVANSIKEFGFKVPIILDKNNIIVAGHTRYKACKKLGINEIPCIIADDLSEEQIKAFRLADNKVSEKAEWNINLLNEELENIINIDMSQFDFINNNLDIENNDFDRTDLSEKIFNKYEIIIKCENEEDLENKYNKLTEEGYECTISTL